MVNWTIPLETKHYEIPVEVVKKDGSVIKELESNHDLQVTFSTLEKTRKERSIVDTINNNDYKEEKKLKQLNTSCKTFTWLDESASSYKPQCKKHTESSENFVEEDNNTNDDCVTWLTSNGPKKDLHSLLKFVASIFLVCILMSPVNCSESNLVSPIPFPTRQYVLLGLRGIVNCGSCGDFASVYWYDTPDEKDAPALIQMVHGKIDGVGYTTNEFNIQHDGSLIINNVTIQHEQMFSVETVSPSFIRTSNTINVTVYVDPPKPVPRITTCTGQPDCIVKADPGGVITCVHANARPAADVSWFMRVGLDNIPLNATTNCTVSSDLATFTTSSNLAISEIPELHPFVQLICKSSQAISVIQDSVSKVVLDVSSRDPFVKEIDDTVHALQNRHGFIIECQPNVSIATSVVMWMYRPLDNRHNEYIIYSAYGEIVSNVKSNRHFNLTNCGGLHIKNVNLRRDGLYACLTITEHETIISLHRLVVVVPPKPSKILVEGCQLFRPCHLKVPKTRVITCAVEGVRPQVYLDMTAHSSNVIVSEIKRNSTERGGLFYQRIQGKVLISNDNYGENGTVLCRGSGPAAYMFKSDVVITIVNVVFTEEEKCLSTSTSIVPGGVIKDTGEKTNLSFLLRLPVILIILLFVSIGIKRMCRKCKPNSRLSAGTRSDGPYANDGLLEDGSSAAEDV